MAEFKQYNLPVEVADALEDLIDVEGGVGTLQNGSLTSADYVRTQSGWRLDSNEGIEINKGQLKINSLTERILFGAATEPLTGVGIFIGKDGDDYEMRFGDPGGDYIHWDGSTLNINGNANDVVKVNGVAAAQVQGRAEKLFTGIVFLGHYNDGLTETTSNCTITRDPIQTSFSTTTAAAANGNLDLDTGMDVFGGWDTSDSEFLVTMKKGGETDNDIFLGLTDDVANWASVPASATNTDNHIGFFIQEDGVGAVTVNASNANGTTQTKTSISVTVTNRNTYRYVYDVGTDIKFYVNDTLLATHTTNLPTGTSSGGGDVQFFMGIKNTSTVASTMKLYNNYSLFMTV